MKHLTPDTIANLKKIHHITADILEDESRKNNQTIVFISDNKSPACSVDLGVFAEGELMLLPQLVNKSQRLLDTLIATEKRLNSDNIDELSITLNTEGEHDFRLFYSSSLGINHVDFDSIAKFETFLGKLLS